MNDTSPKRSRTTLDPKAAHSRVGIASFIFGFLAILTIIIIAGSFFSQSHWNANLPWFTAFFVFLGAVLGVINIIAEGTKGRFGILGLLLSVFSVLACGLLLFLMLAQGFGG